MAQPGHELRRNALMDTQRSTQDLITQTFATTTCKENYNRAYKMFEWGTEYFTFGAISWEEANWHRGIHYSQRGWFFSLVTTNDDAIRRFSGHHPCVLHAMMLNPQVLESLRTTLVEYSNIPEYNREYPRVPICEKLILIIAMNYMDTGCNYKQATNLWQIPKIKFLIKKGLDAIVKLDNIKLFTKAEEWITSMRGWESMHGLPNVVLSFDVTFIRGMTKLPLYYCPENKAYGWKVATAMCSSGMYKSVMIFPGSLLEPELIHLMPFYQRLKATEASLGLPGNEAVRVQDAVPLENYPSRVYWPVDTNMRSRFIETTAPGVLVDDRYSDADCALFVTARNCGRTMHVFNQRHTRTRMYHERLFGKFSQFFHLKMRPMQMDMPPANHPIPTAILAGFMTMNLRNSLQNNPEHACTSFCTCHRVMSPNEASTWLDLAPYPVPTAGEEPRTVSDMIEVYCRMCLEPYTDENIMYLMSQLRWPPLVAYNGVDLAHDAFNRELVRILSSRIAGHFRRRRGQRYEERARFNDQQRQDLHLQRLQEARNRQWRMEEAIENNLEAWWEAFLAPILNPQGHEFGAEFQELLGYVDPDLQRLRFLQERAANNNRQ